MTDTDQIAIPEARVRAARRRLLLMFFLPVVVICAAYVVFFTGLGIPSATTNRGDLVSPPVDLRGLAFRGEAGPMMADEVLGDWLMVYVGDGDCDAECTERLWLTRQIRTALGKESHRVQRLYLDPDPVADAPLRRLLDAEHRDLRWLHVDGQAWDALLAASDAPSRAAGAFYLVDPRGFLMMAYTPEHAGKDTIEDLRFLMRYSWERREG
jgi:hypothetical protein